MLPPPPPEAQQFEQRILQSAEQNDFNLFQQTTQEVLAQPNGPQTLAWAFQSTISQQPPLTGTLLGFINQSQMQPQGGQIQPMQPQGRRLKQAAPQAEQNPLWESWSLAVKHLIATNQPQPAAEAVWLTLSQEGPFAQYVGMQLDQMISQVGCNPPVTDTFTAVQQLQQQQQPGVATQQGMAPQAEMPVQGNPQVFEQNAQAFPALQQCYQQTTQQAQPQP